MSRDKHVLVLGGTGFLGSYFVKKFGAEAKVHTTQSTGLISEKNYQSMLFQRNQVKEIEIFLKKQNCGIVINCTAMAEIEKCELNPALAYWVNSELPGVLASLSKSLEFKLVHISTDAVFDGTTSFRSEFESPLPLSTYGKSKLSGEQLVLERNPESIVARVNFFGYSRNKPSLFNFFFENLVSGKYITGFADVHFTPLYANDTVNVITELLRLNESGLFHVVGDERISKYEFGLLVAEIFGLPSTYINQGKLIGSEGALLRSPDLSLSNEKIKSLGIDVPTVQDGLSTLKKNLK